MRVGSCLHTPLVSHARTSGWRLCEIGCWTKWTFLGVIQRGASYALIRNVLLGMTSLHGRPTSPVRTPQCV